jgi:hypothetical protein
VGWRSAALSFGKAPPVKCLCLLLCLTHPVSHCDGAPSSLGRFLVLRARALICYQKDCMGPPETVWRIDKVIFTLSSVSTLVCCACT